MLLYKVWEVCGGLCLHNDPRPKINNHVYATGIGNVIFAGLVKVK